MPRVERCRKRDMGKDLVFISGNPARGCRILQQWAESPDLWAMAMDWSPPHIRYLVALLFRSILSDTRQIPGCSNINIVLVGSWSCKCHDHPQAKYRDTHNQVCLYSFAMRWIFVRIERYCLKILTATTHRLVWLVIVTNFYESLLHTHLCWLESLPVRILHIWFNQTQR